MDDPQSVSRDMDVLVIGAGFYGCALALELKKYFQDVMVLEKNGAILQGASFKNQARVHAGFHYPRNLVTAYRSFLNYPRFIAQYPSAIYGSFHHYYAVARKNSRINASQFQKIFGSFPAKLGAPPPAVRRWFNPDLIEDVFEVEEWVFDAAQLAKRMLEDLDRTRIPLRLNEEVVGLSFEADGRIRVRLKGSDQIYRCRYLFNCTYSGLNTLRASFAASSLSLKHELAELALVEPPKALGNAGITVMDGAFFSILPFPAKGLHSLSHVRYTPHRSWQSDGGTKDLAFGSETPASNFIPMVKDAQRYVPALEGLRYRESLFEVKTVLQQNELDDGRPILFVREGPSNNFFNVLGGKIDNIYDIIETLREVLPSLQ